MTSSELSLNDYGLNLCLNEMAIYLYVLGPFMKHWIGGDVHSNLIITHERHKSSI